MTAEFTETSARRLGPVRRFLLRHPVAMDALVVAVFLLSLVPVAARPEPTAYYLLVVLAAGALWFRRARPLTVLVVLLGLAVVMGTVATRLEPLDLAVAFALYAVATTRDAKVAWGAYALALVVTATVLWFAPATGELTYETPQGAEALTPTQQQAWALAVTTTALLYLLAVAIGTSVRNRRRHLADLLDRANALARDRELQARMARAEERSRIAREMHDVVAHSLSVMITLADGAGAALDRSPERAREALTELGTTGRAALTDVRRILGVLDGAADLDPQPGAGDLTTLAERFRTAGLPVRLTRTGPDLPDDAGLQLAVYRIVQESLTNALRHASGTERVDATVAVGRDAVVVDVTDRGGPVPAPPGVGRGLVGMRERAAVYGGTVTSGPDPHGGWRVHAELPIENGDGR